MQKKSLLIGATPRLLTHEGTLRQIINDNYVEALVKYGLNVILINLDNPNIEEVLGLCDGFLVTGGCDLDPVLYGETNDEGLSEGIEARVDKLDGQVIKYAVEHNKPLLGICRGIQSINVFMGGTLHQHIGHDHEGKKQGHMVNTFPNDLLPFTGQIEVNSYHHQAVKDPAPGLKVFAQHPDGTIEGLVGVEKPIIALQWHPERLQDTYVSKTIFSKFKELCEKYAK